MTKSTALVFATDGPQNKLLVENLKATGLFQQILPVTSITAMFQHLKTKRADMICWVIEKTNCRYEWINRLQADDQWHDLPLIAFAKDNQSLIDSFEHGASDALSLEIGSLELSARMNCHLQRWNRLLDLRKTQEELQRMALTDPLTGLGNRATFDMSLKQIAASAKRNSSAYSLILIDLDHFKKINDTYGHQSGDIVLQKVAAEIADAAREADICCRYGGEEFAVILPDTTTENAAILAQRIHQHLASLSPKEIGIPASITASIGISGILPPRYVSTSRLTREADMALYQAKKNGRNRTESRHLSATATGNNPHRSYPQVAAAQFA